jgi:hypothetical protein
MANEIIAPERHGFFIVVAFILAIIGLLLGLLGVYRNQALAVGTQIEIVALSKKMKRLEARIESSAGGTQAAAREREGAGD